VATEDDSADERATNTAPNPSFHRMRPSNASSRRASRSNRMELDELRQVGGHGDAFVMRGDETDDDAASVVDSFGSGAFSESDSNDDSDAGRRRISFEIRSLDEIRAIRRQVRARREATRRWMYDIEFGDPHDEFEQDPMKVVPKRMRPRVRHSTYSLRMG